MNKISANRKRQTILKIYIRNLVALYLLSCGVLFSIFFYLEVSIKKYFYEEQDSLLLGAFKQYERIIEAAMLSNNQFALKNLIADPEYLPEALRKEFIEEDLSSVELDKVVACNKDLLILDWGFVCREGSLATYYIQIQTTTNLIGFAKIKIEQKFYNWRPFRILLIGIISFWIIYSFVLVMMILRFLKKVYRPTLKAIEDIKTASTSQDFDAVINTLSFQEIYDLAFLLSQQSQHAAIGKTTQLVAHDVRKPFTQIKLILSMFKKFASSPKKLEEAKLEVEHSIENVEAMLKEIMDSTRSFSFKQEAVSLFELFDLSVRQLSVVDRRSKVDLAYDFRHSSKAYVDKDKIVRCLTNILENAVEATTKSTSKGKGRIFVTSKDQDGQIRIIISNNGPIINDEDIAKVFDPFYTKGKVTGTGLGLASVRRIITLHGGKVIAQNKATMDGVEFVITIPASKTPDGNIKAKSLPGRI